MKLRSLCTLVVCGSLAGCGGGSSAPAEETGTETTAELAAAPRQPEETQPEAAARARPPVPEAAQPVRAAAR